MSTEHIEALIRDAEHDQALRRELRESPDLHALVRLGASRGYRFTLEELDAHFAANAPAELSELELDLVSGGAGATGSNAVRSAVAAKLDRCFVKSWSTSGDAD